MWLLVRAVNVTGKSTGKRYETKEREIINNSTYIATDVNVGLSYAWLTGGMGLTGRKPRGRAVMGHLRCGNPNPQTAIRRITAERKNINKHC